MRRKLFRRLFLFLLLLLTWLDLNRFAVAPVSKIGRAIPIFPQIQIDLLRAKDQALVADAVKETTKMLLQYLVPQDDREPWESRFLFVDLLGDSEPEVIYALTLPPEKGLLVLLQKEGQNYLLVSYRADLLPISKLETLPLTTTPPLFVTREDHQERFGAFCETSVLTVWRWQKNQLKEVFSENIYWEINWLNTWQNPGATPEKWGKLKQAMQVTCQEKAQQEEDQPKKASQIQLLVEGKQEYSEASTPTPAPQATALPAEYQFSTIQTRKIAQTYYWDEEWQSFILRTGFYQPPDKKGTEKIAVLKDLDTHLENLAANTATAPNNTGYLVTDQQGNTFTIAKKMLLD